MCELGQDCPFEQRGVDLESTNSTKVDPSATEGLEGPQISPSVDPVNHPYCNPGAFDSKLRSFGWTVTGDGCWEWAGSRMRSRGGYGQVRWNGRTMKAHRLAYMAWVGPLRDDLFVCHTCDNPPCINPDHLFAGTPADNNWDKAHKGRGVNPVMRGEDSPNAVLTEQAVLEIRRRLASGWSLASLASRYGVTKQAIWRIKERKTWRHI